MKPNTANDEKLRPKDLGFMVLSIIAVMIVMLIAFGNLEPEISDVLELIDVGICIIFIGNFFFDLAGSQNRKRYIFTHWIDLIASIPVIAFSGIAIPSDSNIFRYARFFQVLRVVRLIKASHYTLIPLLKERKKETTLIVLMLTMITIITLASALILLVEHDASGAKIKSAEDAIWWALITISTVGYGDYYPVTLGGRLIAALLILVGVAFFSVAAGFIASKFVSWSQEDEEENTIQQQQKELLEEIRELRKKLDSRDN